MMLHLRHWPLVLAMASCLLFTAATSATPATPATPATSAPPATSTATSSLSSIPGKYQALGAAHHQAKKLKIGDVNASSSDANKPVFRQNPIKNWFGAFNRNNSPAAQNQTSPTCSCRWVVWFEFVSVCPPRDTDTKLKLRRCNTHGEIQKLSWPWWQLPVRRAKKW